MKHHEDGPECPLCAEKLETAHPFIAHWFDRKKEKYPNLHISWAFRSEADQNAAVKEGRSKLPWPKSPHNHMENKEPCSLALDLFQIDDDGVARLSRPFYALLNKENETDREPIFWGGKWAELGDFDHFQMQISGS